MKANPRLQVSFKNNSRRKIKQLFVLLPSFCQDEVQASVLKAILARKKTAGRGTVIYSERCRQVRVKKMS